MNFQQRFKGKTSVIDKEGIEGIVKQKALPIQKDISIESNELSSQMNSRILLSQQKVESQKIRSLKQSALKKSQSHQTNHLDQEHQFNNNSYSNQTNQKLPTKIITNIRQPQDLLTSTSEQPQFVNKNGSQIKNSPKNTTSNQSTAASQSQFKRNADQIVSQHKPLSLIDHKNNSVDFNDLNGYSIRPKVYSHNNLSNLQQLSNNGSISTDSINLKSQRSKSKINENQNIFQNRLQQRIMSGAQYQQPQPIMFSTGNYENQFRAFSYDQKTLGDQSPLNYTGPYKLPSAINQIIVPQDYELIAIPRNQIFNINSPISHSQIQSGLTSGNTSSRVHLPMIASNNNINSNYQINYQSRDSFSNRLPYQQSVNILPTDDLSYTNKYSNGMQQILSRKSLINSGKSILDSTSNLKSNKPQGLNTFRYELDLMEEKHRDIIDNLEKIREKRTKK
ncbi:hypothetical protein TTHERM_00497700 (macronuclear) [Tetrahymena thermophila SB210]|uniref:Uncharacterized protein n=1 Tax=Tetrahymena thermophila (strain SB210) TaxID=312017 RepID=I7MB61_TETTS|nr:hypothetical protein TTHERM_00497700 [Tetrahymena thermophila SB210]EAS07716.2 hypothetical protein TTHERM_00497700 [Tetrahymena thermophila SB210]|eukprot:XP_001027958.2 hypothetical protein TTHERM_00497700 [Tetrahymena thermophila SB210]